MHGHILQRKTLLQTIPKMLFAFTCHLYSTDSFCELKKTIQLKYVGPLTSNQTMKHSSFTNLLIQRSCKEDWQFLLP